MMVHSIELSCPYTTGTTTPRESNTTKMKTDSIQNKSQNVPSNSGKTSDGWLRPRSAERSSGTNSSTQPQKNTLRSVEERSRSAEKQRRRILAVANAASEALDESELRLAAQGGGSSSSFYGGNLRNRNVVVIDNDVHSVVDSAKAKVNVKKEDVGRGKMIGTTRGNAAQDEEEESQHLLRSVDFPEDISAQGKYATKFRNNNFPSQKSGRENIPVLVSSPERGHKDGAQRRRSPSSDRRWSPADKELRSLLDDVMSEYQSGISDYFSDSSTRVCSTFYYRIMTTGPAVNGIIYYKSS